MRTAALILASLAIAAAAQASVVSTVEPFNKLYTDAEVMAAFTKGIAAQLAFEMGGLTIRFFRLLRASGSPDIGG